MRNKIFTSIIWEIGLMISIIWWGCTKNPVETLQPRASVEMQYVVPSLVPESVESAAFERAPKRKELIIRFLLLTGNGIKDDTYYVTFFEENDILESLVLHFDSSTGDVEVLNNEQGIFNDFSLQRSSGVDNISKVNDELVLVNFYEHWNYGGRELNIWCGIPGPGYFWRLVPDFQPLGFNDIASSHKSNTWSYGSYLVTVLVVHVFKHANYSGSDHQYTGQQALWDNNYADEGMNDKVSSVRIKYWVTPPY